MSRERWGTFSVRDHMNDQPFVVDVLMYDRLVIPRPPEDRRKEWAENGWDPDRLDAVLEVLRSEGDPKRRHAVAVDWDEKAEEVFKERATVAKVMTSHEKFQMSARLLTYELLPKPPQGVIPSVVAAYSSTQAAEDEWVQDRHESLTLAIRHEFLVPKPNDRSYLDNLKDSVALADDATFRSKRALMYKWQEDVIHRGISNADALLEMEQYISDYNNATKAAVRDVYTKFAFTLVPIALGALAGPMAPLVAVGNIANLLRFWIYDRKPKVNAGDSEVAAMLHDVRQELHWREPR